MTQPTKGALRAGKACADYVQAVLDRKKLNRGADALSEIIDRETGVAELLEAAKAVHAFLWKERGQTVGMAEVRLSESLRQAIAKCEGRT